MRSTIVTAHTIFALALTMAAPVSAGVSKLSFLEDAPVLGVPFDADVIAKRGRGGDDDGDNDTSGSGRDKPRIPGGSGCDDPGDVLEHPECSA